MKIQLGEWFLAGGRGVEYEKRILDYRRADLVVSNERGREVAVVECQTSPISIPELEERTQDYNDQGLAVMWVWDAARLFGRTTRSFPPKFKPAQEEDQPEYRIPAEIRHLHDECDERLFVLDAAGELRVCSFDEAAERYNDWWGSSYTPKTLKCIYSCPFQPQQQLVPHLYGELRYVVPHSVRDKDLIAVGGSQGQHQRGCGWGANYYSIDD